MSLTPIRIGLIGYRGFGAFCTETYHQANAGRVIAFAGRDSQAMAETARRLDVPTVYADWRDLVADPTVELVHIVTPPNLHKEMAVLALEAGKHVFVEKPLATTQADAQAILDAAQAAGKYAGINYVMRYNPLYECVNTIARAGWLGKLTHVEFQNYASDEGLDDAHWFWDKAQSGGIFVEHGVHFFDIIGSIISAPMVKTTAQTWVREDGTNKEDRVQAIVTYANGIEATYYHAFNRPGALEKQSAHFAFERGHLTLEGWIPRSLTLSALVTDAERDALAALLPLETVSDADFSGPAKTIRGNGSNSSVQHRVTAYHSLGDPDPVYQQAVGDALADLAQAIRSPGHIPRVTAADGAASLQVALAAAEAATLGQSVEPSRP